jgi:serine/threonine protein kinase
MESLIGNGCFGYVFQGLDKSTRKKVAWKRMLKLTKMMSREYEILAKIRGRDNVIQLVDFFYSVNYRNELIQNFIFPYCDSNLEDLLKLHISGELHLSYIDIKKMVFQILRGLSEIHKLNICHRDLKPENVLMKEGVIMISDFGSSKELSDHNTPYVVSRYYRAPELIFGIANYTLSIDIFSLGVIFYEFLAKKLPFKGKTEGQQLIEIFKALGPPTGDIKHKIMNAISHYDNSFDLLWKIKSDGKVWEPLSKLSLPADEKHQIIRFINACWDYDFENRPNGCEAIQLAFFDDVRNNFEITLSKF